MRFHSLLQLLPLLVTPLSHAALVWTGGGDAASLYLESNWTDDNGATPANNTINGNTAITAATGGLISITTGSGSPSNFNGSFILGDDNSLEVGNGKNLSTSGTSTLTASGANPSLSLFNNAILKTGAVSGFTSITVASSDMTVNSSSGINSAATYGTFSISGTGTVNSQFLVNWDMTLSGAANLTLRGGGDPINSTQIDLASSWTGFIYTTNEAVADWTNPASAQTWREISGLTHLEKITVDGSAAVLGLNVDIVSDGGSGAYLTVIPEPATPLLGGLGLLALFRRRRSQRSTI